MCEVDDIIKLAMVKSYCFPLLTYCLSALSLTRRCVQDVGVCWNDCFRRIFRYNRYESVKDLQLFCNELPLELVYDLAKWKSLFDTSHVPVSIRILFTLQNHAMSDLTKKYGHAKSGHTMKRLVFFVFCNVT